MHDPCMQHGLGNTRCGKLIQLIINYPITYYRCAKLYQLDGWLSSEIFNYIVSCILFSLSHQGPARKPEAYGAGNHYLHYHFYQLDVITWWRDCGDLCRVAEVFSLQICNCTALLIVALRWRSNDCRRPTIWSHTINDIILMRFNAHGT